jgi:uncharacterized delta-60 repeat protein
MNKIKNLLLTLVLTSLTTTIRPLVINKNTQPKWTYQTIKAGTVDGSFGTDGSYNPGTGNKIYTIQTQKDGKILIAGSYDNEWHVERLLTDGTLDAAFGNTTPTTNGIYTGVATTNVIKSIVLQSDGKILIAGDDNSTGWRVERLLANGTLDTTFNADVTPGSYKSLIADQSGDIINAMELQSDGKILIAGKDYSAGWRVERLLANGTIDTTFGNATPTTDGGYISATADATLDVINAMQIQEDGKILIAGADYSAGWRVERLLTDGTLDATFGNTTPTTDGAYKSLIADQSNDNINAMVLQSDGKILIAGEDGSIDWHVERLSTDGTLDTEFGNNGYHTPTTTDEAYAIAVQADGKILIVGEDGSNGWRLERLTVAGAFDSDFGTNGVFSSSTANTDNDKLYALLIQADGKILIAGEDNDAGWRVERLLNDVNPLTQISANGNNGFIG